MYHESSVSGSGSPDCSYRSVQRRSSGAGARPAASRPACAAPPAALARRAWPSLRRIILLGHGRQVVVARPPPHRPHAAGPHFLQDAHGQRWEELREVACKLGMEVGGGAGCKWWCDGVGSGRVRAGGYLCMRVRVAGHHGECRG